MHGVKPQPPPAPNLWIRVFDAEMRRRYGMEEEEGCPRYVTCVVTSDGTTMFPWWASAGRLIQQGY